MAGDPGIPGDPCKPGNAVAICPGDPDGEPPMPGDPGRPGDPGVRGDPPGICPGDPCGDTLGICPGDPCGDASGPPSMFAPMPGAPIAGGDAFGPDGATMPGDDVLSALPQLRQNFIPGGFSPRQTLQTLGVGNPWGRAGVCPNAGANELPQLRQNDDPGGLSWPHIEQRIGPLSQRACSNTAVTGMGPGLFATLAPAW